MGTSLRRSDNIGPESPTKNLKDGDETLACVLELVAIMTSPNGETLSMECDKIMKELRSAGDSTLPDGLMDEGDDDDLNDQLNALMKSSSSSRHLPNMVVRDGRYGEGDAGSDEERKLSENALKFLIDGGQDMDGDSDEGRNSLDDLVSEDTSDVEFGEPFLTSLKGVQDKFLIVPMHIPGQQDGLDETLDNSMPASLMEAREDPYGFNKLSDVERDAEARELARSDADTQDLFDDIAEARSEDRGEPNDSLDDLAEVWAKINPQTPEQEVAADGEALYKIELDLAKLNDDLENLKRP